MRDRSGWVRGIAGPRVIKGKTYKNLIEFTRACATCTQPFSIFVTEKIASGQADSNSFGLKNCEAHRRGGVVQSVDVKELEMLRSKDRTMSEELSTLYLRNKELLAENLALRTQLAKYDLPAALHVVAEKKLPWQ